jgi:hypothetical protein
MIDSDRLNEIQTLAAPYLEQPFSMENIAALIKKLEAGPLQGLNIPDRIRVAEFIASKFGKTLP